MEAQSQHEYIGKELELFSGAKNWADYIKNQIRPYLHGTVIEVGAGIGSRTKQLSKFADHWIAIEPDYQMWLHLKKIVASNPSMNNVQVINGTLNDLPKDIFADVILYVDVLEHIESDNQELLIAAGKLNPKGFLVVLSPAYQWLYSEFDRSIGHWRRYSLKDLIGKTPSQMRVAKERMLDSIGMCASIANKLFLKKNMPTKQQISFWDSFLLRASRFIDPLISYSIGKSVLVIWQKVE
jgi:SAM-dependent methyltransferase